MGTTQLMRRCSANPQPHKHSKVFISLPIPHLRPGKALGEHTINMAAINAASKGRQGKPVCDFRRGCCFKSILYNI